MCCGGLRARALNYGPTCRPGRWGDLGPVASATLDLLIRLRR